MLVQSCSSIRPRTNIRITSRHLAGMPALGTFETSGDVRLASAFRGKTEDMGSQRVFRLLTDAVEKVFLHR
jgi:hypothetical protein